MRFASLRAALIGWAPAGILVIGLVALLGLAASDEQLSRAMSVAGSGREWDLYPVGGLLEVFDYLEIGPWEPGLARRPWWLTLGLTTTYLTSVAAIGAPLARIALGRRTWPAPVVALAGFLPGYVMVLAPLRILFSAVHYSSAAWVAVAAMPVVAGAIHRRAIRSWLGGLRARSPSLKGSGIVVLCAGLIAFAFAHRLQAHQFFLTQDSIQTVVKAAIYQLEGSYGPYLAQWNLQSDEWVFNAPLMFTSRNVGDLWFPIYATQCVSLASFLVLIYTVVHRLTARRQALAGVLATAAVFGMSLAIQPWLYVTTIIGGQPVSEVGHPGRQVAMLAPVFAVLGVAGMRRSWTVPICLATIGLGFITINGLLWVLVAVAVACAWRWLPAASAPSVVSRTTKAVAYCGPVVTMVAVVLALHVGPTDTSAAGIAWALLAAGAIAVLAALCTMAETSRAERARSVRLSVRALASWLPAAALGLVLSVNLTADLLHGSLRKALGAVLPGFNAIVLRREDLEHGQLQDISFPRLSYDGCETFVTCRGGWTFLAGIGVLLVLALATWAGSGQIRPGAVGATARLVALALCLAGFCFGWILVLFVGGSLEQSIIASRLLEVPYYGIIVLAAMTFAESRSRVTAATGCAVMAAWTIGPLVAVQWPEQVARNTGYYLHHLF